MPKKKSIKTPAKVLENSAVEEEKPSSVQKKLGSEIDEIFAGKKRKKPKEEKNEKFEIKNQDPTENPMKKKKRKNEKGSEDDGYVNRLSRPKRRTNDGLAIYTEEELGINKADAGGTPLCPFDCSCCF